eukprot:TRINITY_DN8049_c0_g1_i3.p2 TRINITY_DN8049_c0_g1~~TRINITY_DN8049_c0_g1_i3.p2  ORF type:complete len:103 (-),score=6.27 TRINITY_DN8049_c0_g1_i3:254-562(-)
MDITRPSRIPKKQKRKKKKEKKKNPPLAFPLQFLSRWSSMFFVRSIDGQHLVLQLSNQKPKPLTAGADPGIGKGGTPPKKKKKKLWKAPLFFCKTPYVIGIS